MNELLERAKARYAQELVRAQARYPVGTRVLVDNELGTGIAATVLGFEPNNFYKLLVVTDNAGVAYLSEITKEV